MIEIVPMEGAPYARGRSAGERLGEKVRGHLAGWLDALSQAHGNGEGAARLLLEETDFLPDIERYAPDLLEEVRGLADGAGVERDLIVALQLLDEEWAWRARRGGAPIKREKCSSLAIVDVEGPTWIGQNMDLGPYTDGWQALLSIEAFGEAPAALVFTGAGMIGLLGVNAAGLGVCVNSLPQLPSASHGLPVAFVIRLLLAAKNLTEASRLVLALPHATNQNYMLAEPGAVRAFEASAAGVNEFRPVHPGRILHTNHPLAADKGAPETADQRANSVARLHALTNRLGSGAANLANIKDALSSYDDPKNPVSRMWNPQAGLTGFTTGSMISALREGVRPRTWVSAGPPHLRGYEEIVVGEPAPA